MVPSQGWLCCLRRISGTYWKSSRTRSGSFLDWVSSISLLQPWHPLWGLQMFLLVKCGYAKLHLCLPVWVKKNNNWPLLFFRATGNPRYWIGLNDEASEGNFVYTDGSPGEKWFSPVCNAAFEIYLYFSAAQSKKGYIDLVCVCIALFFQWPTSAGVLANQIIYK